MPWTSSNLSLKRLPPTSIFSDLLSQTPHGDFSVNQDAEPPPTKKAIKVLYQASTRHLLCLAEIETIPANSCRLRVYNRTPRLCFPTVAAFPKHGTPTLAPSRDLIDDGSCLDHRRRQSLSTGICLLAPALPNDNATSRFFLATDTRIACAP